MFSTEGLHDLLQIAAHVLIHTVVTGSGYDSVGTYVLQLQRDDEFHRMELIWFISL